MIDSYLFNVDGQDTNVPHVKGHVNFSVWTNPFTVAVTLPGCRHHKHKQMNDH